MVKETVDWHQQSCLTGISLSASFFLPCFYLLPQSLYTLLVPVLCFFCSLLIQLHYSFILSRLELKTDYVPHNYILNIDVRILGTGGEPAK